MQDFTAKAGLRDELGLLFSLDLGSEDESGGSEGTLVDDVEEAGHGSPPPSWGALAQTFADHAVLSTPGLTSTPPPSRLLLLLYVVIVIELAARS